MKKLGGVRNPLHHSHPLILLDATSSFGGWSEHEDRIGGTEELVLDGVRAFLAGRSDHGPAVVFANEDELIIVNPEGASKSSVDDLARAPRSKLKSLGTLEIPSGRLVVAIAYYPVNRTIARAKKHTPESKLEIDVGGAAVFEVLGNESKRGSRFVLRRTRGAAKPFKTVQRKTEKATSKRSAKVEAMMALLAGDPSKLTKILRAHYAEAARIERAGLDPAEVKAALSSKGDPPLSFVVKLVALRGADEIESFDELRANAPQESAKIAGIITLLDGDASRFKKVLRAHYAEPAPAKRAGLEPDEVKAALSSKGDPPLSLVVKLAAGRGADEAEAIEAWAGLGKS